MSEQQPDKQPEQGALTYNEDFTHVLTVAKSGVPWLCPVGYLETAREQGYRPVTAAEYEAASIARDRELDAVVPGPPVPLEAPPAAEPTEPVGDPAEPVDPPVDPSKSTAKTTDPSTKNA